MAHCRTFLSLMCSGLGKTCDGIELPRGLYIETSSEADFADVWTDSFIRALDSGMAMLDWLLAGRFYHYKEGN